MNSVARIGLKYKRPRPPVMPPPAPLPPPLVASSTLVEGAPPSYLRLSVAELSALRSDSVFPPSIRFVCLETSRSAAVHSVLLAAMCPPYRQGNLTSVPSYNHDLHHTNTSQVASATKKDAVITEYHLDSKHAGAFLSFLDCTIASPRKSLNLIAIYSLGPSQTSQLAAACNVAQFRLDFTDVPTAYASTPYSRHLGHENDDRFA